MRTPGRGRENPGGDLSERARLVTRVRRDHAYFVSSISRIAAVTLENLLKLDSLRAENQQPRAEVEAPDALIGESRPMRRVSEFIARVAKGDSTVLIRGESGTGKELQLPAPFTPAACAPASPS